MDAAQLRARLAAIVGPSGVVSSLEERRTYESDGLQSYRATPGIVVLPETAERRSRSRSSSTSTASRRCCIALA